MYGQISGTLVQNGATQGTGTAADRSIIYTLLYIQGPVCMSEMGPDVQLPEKRLNCHLFAIPTLLLPFLFHYCQSATTTSLQPSLAADRPDVAIAGSGLCDFFLDEDGLLPEWDKDSKHSKRKYSKRYLKTITIHSSDLRPHGFNVPLWYEDVEFHHCCPHCFSHLSLPPSDQPPCLQSSVQLWCALPHRCRASRNPFCLLQLW